MNEWHRQQEREQQERKYRDLEFRFHDMERERDRYKNERDEMKRLLQIKTNDFSEYKNSVDQKLEEFRDSLLYLPQP